MSLTMFLRTGKNTAMLLAGTMARMVAGFIFVIYCADKMGVEGFGKYSIAIHYFELFLSLVATAVGILLTRDIARWPRHMHQLFTSAVLLCLSMCLIAIGAMWGLGALFDYSSDTRHALLIASLALIPGSVCVIIEAVFVARERAEFVTAGIATESLLRIVFSAALLYQGFGLIALFWVLLMARCALLLVYVVNLQQIGVAGWSFHRQRSGRFVRRWRMFAAENWMASIYTNLDVIMLSWIAGAAATGIYSAAWKIVRLGSVVAKSYTTAVFPLMSRLYMESRDSYARLCRQTLRVMCGLALPAIAVISVVPHRVIGLLFSDEYVASGAVLQVLIWVLLIEFLNPFLSHALFAQGRQDRSMRVAAISLVVNSVASYLLIVRYGATGAALGTVIGGLVATCCYLLLTVPKREIVATTLPALRVALAACGLGMVVYFVRGASWLQLILIATSVYMAMLVVVGAVRREDLRFFRATFFTRAT